MKLRYLSFFFAFFSFGCALVGSNNGDKDTQVSAGGAGADSDGNADAVSDPNWYHYDAWVVRDWADSGDAAEEICKDAEEVARLEDLYMAFAFDVSGSMGKGDKCYHDKELKWDPVSDAASSFLEEKASTGLWASMTFFPAMDNKCEDYMYLFPDVPFTQLPTAVFREAFEFIILTEGFRGRTPTIHVLRGVLSYVRTTREQSAGNYVIVLVTDGVPEHCPDNSIASVVALAAEAAADGLPTYVIGINNPPCGPETLDDLNEIAVGGETEKAFLIDTGDPEKTANDFNAVVESIREAVVPCTLIIPDPPMGQEFNKQKVKVLYELGTMTTELVYNRDCQGPNAWRYDDPVSPAKIVLCEETCETVRGDLDTKIKILFTCKEVLVV